MSDKNRDIVEKVNAAFAENKPGIFLAYCADDARWVMAGDRIFDGKDAIKEFMASMDGMEPPKFTVDEIIADGDSVACYGDMAMAEDGKPATYTFCDVYRFDKGMITNLVTIMVKHKTEGESAQGTSA